MFLFRALSGFVAAVALVAAVLLWRMSLRSRSRRRIYQAVALAACAAVVVSVIPRLAPRAPGGANGGGARSAAERTVRLDRSLRAIEEGERRLPRDRWDPEYIVQTVGRDPQTLFEWVRDNTFWIPYHGVLRGPVGVLMDRRGNSLDRSVLLAKLLERAGYTVRLVHGELTPNQALDLLPRLEASRAAAFTPSEPANAPKSDVKVTAAKDSLQSQRQAFAETTAELRSRVADQTQRLLKAIARPNSTELRSRSFGTAIEALTDHWWVQGRKGLNWVDLDLLAGRPGPTLAAAKETAAMTDLPADLHHTVTLRVVAEQWSGGTLTEHNTLEQVLRPSDLYGHSVVLQFWPAEWIEQDSGTSRHTRAGALSQDAWDAFVVVDRTPLTAGLLLENGDDPDAAPKGGALGGLGAAVAGALGAKPNDGNRHLSAVWLEYEIHVPGETPRIIRRTIFDLLGPASRATASPRLALDQSKRLTRALALTMKSEILPVACGLSPEFVAALVARNLVTDRDLFNYLIKGDLPAGIPDLERLFGRSSPPVSTLYGLALARLQLSETGQVFIDRPNILSRHLYPVASGDGLDFVDATDIVANEIGVGLSVRDPFAARLAQGVLDTNAESLFQPRGNPSVSVADAFAASRSWIAFAPEQDAAAASKVSLPDDVRRQIGSDLEAGYAVVAPEKAVAMHPGEFAGWWRIDRTTGDALGMGANGWGATLPGYGSRISWSARIGAILKIKLATFAVAFTANYGWCVAPLIVKHIENKYGEQPFVEEGTNTRKLHYGMGLWEGAIKPSFGECVGDSIFVGGITAWMLPTGVVGEGDTPKGQSDPFESPNTPGGSGGRGKGGGKPSGTGNPPNEPNPEPQPKPKDKRCDDGTQPGEPPADPQPPEPPPALQQQLLDAERNVYAAKIAYRQANEAAMEAMGEAYRYRAGPEWRGGKPFDPAKYQELKNIADREGRIADQRLQELLQAQRALKAIEDSIRAANRRPQQSGLGCGPSGGGDAKPPAAPGPGPDPVLDPNGPPTVPDPRVRIPGNTDNPFANTQPGDDPFAQTQPGTPAGGSPPGPNGPSNDAPPGPPPQSWDGKPCPWCSSPTPTPTDTSSSDADKIHNAPPPTEGPQSPGWYQAIGNALGELPGIFRSGPVTGGAK